MKKVLVLFIVLISISAVAKKPKKPVSKPQTRSASNKAKKSKKVKRVPRAPSHSAAFLTDARMSAINLQGLEIWDSGYNDLKYQFHPVDQVTKDVENIIFSYSGNKVISKIYESDQANVFKGVYLYVAKVDVPVNDPFIPKSQYVLIELFINKLGSSFVTRHYITAGNASSLKMYRYKKDSLHTAKNPNGKLFLN